jgi:hypothetical protein
VIARRNWTPHLDNIQLQAAGKIWHVTNVFTNPSSVLWWQRYHLDGSPDGGIRVEWGF